MQSSRKGLRTALTATQGWGQAVCMCTCMNTHVNTYTCMPTYMHMHEHTSIYTVQAKHPVAQSADGQHGSVDTEPHVWLIGQVPRAAAVQVPSGGSALPPLYPAASTEVCPASQEQALRRGCMAGRGAVLPHVQPARGVARPPATPPSRGLGQGHRAVPAMARISNRATGMREPTRSPLLAGLRQPATGHGFGRGVLFTSCFCRGYSCIAQARAWYFEKLTRSLWSWWAAPRDPKHHDPQHPEQLQ